MKQTNLSSVLGRWFVIAVPYTWLLVLFLIPFLIVLKISFAEQDIAIPPYTPLVTADSDMGRVIVQASYLNYADIVKDFWQSLGQILNPFHDGNGDNIYLQTYWSSLKTALMVTVLCLVFGYPIAYAISRVREDIRNGVLLLIMLPFWTSFLLRVYAWMGILSTTGLLNTWLQTWGVINQPLDLFYNQFSLILVMVYAYLPFMILPLYTQLLQQDHRL